ncbi:MAG: Dabb family protein [Pseudomonadota bacterium]|nr:Dabb family protein [Rhodocyclaceae bacterium]
MITHLVLFKLKPGIAPDDRRFVAVQAAMEALPRKISVIRSWQHGRNLTPDDDAWDYGLVATFDSEADLHAYFEHPEHLPVLAQWNEIASLAFVDLAG